MPIYEYSCGACNDRFELLVPMSEASTQPPCPSCKSPNTQKLLSLFARSCGGSVSDPGAGPGGAPPSGGGGHSHGGGGCGCGRF